MANKKGSSKKGDFALTPITLSEPVKIADGFTNLVETPAEKEKTAETNHQPGSNDAITIQPKAKRNPAANQTVPSKSARSDDSANEKITKADNNQSGENDEKADDFSLTTGELLRILDADSLDEIYELTDVLRASSLKLYATLVRLADSRGRARIKNHELMSKAGIKGIATLYKQERWLMDLKLLEKKAKPGPHDGSSYVVHELESLPLPAEIYEKFADYLSDLK